MNITEYQLKHAREILEPCGVLGEYLLLDDRGVWPAVERDMTMLPVPFTARQLAAFMLEGVGALVADFYGDWCDGRQPYRTAKQGQRCAGCIRSCP